MKLFLVVLTLISLFLIQGCPKDRWSVLNCTKPAGSLPNPKIPAGTPNASVPIEHIIVIMQENHSFDNYFGRLNQPEFYGSQVDGVEPSMSNLLSDGKRAPVYHETNLCVPDVPHSWNAMHKAWNNGKNDQFAMQSDARAMGYFDQTDLPFYYAIANRFVIADRYFHSALSPTFPNRYFLLAGTAFGHIRNIVPDTNTEYKQKTIFDILDQYGVNWKYYTNDEGYLKLFGPLYEKDKHKMAEIADYEYDLTHRSLPQVVFLDAAFDGEDEHPDANIQVGQAWVAARVRGLLDSPYWYNSVLFLTYDEGGGFFDHVPPPAACVPDNVPPMLQENSYPAKYDRYGFRVPFIAVSPFAKKHHVSHVTYDHTSILKFIETKFNLPALTKRDANADSMMDLFDFKNPQYEVGPLPSGEPDPARACKPKS